MGNVLGTLVVLLGILLFFSFPVGVIALLIRHAKKNAVVVEDIQKYDRYAIAEIIEIKYFPRTKYSDYGWSKELWVPVVSYIDDCGNEHISQTLRSNYGNLKIGDKLQIRYSPIDYEIVLYGPQSEPSNNGRVRTIK